MKRLEKLIKVYEHLDADSLHLLESCYAPDIIFTDPAHRIEGLPALLDYFSALYENVDEVRFTFTHRDVHENHGYLEWRMSVKHPRLQGGTAFTIDGFSHLVFNEDGLACRHRDYFDLGAMLYERVPLLGPVVRFLKGRLGT